jgi:PAS domain S-box-containing protein
MTSGEQAGESRWARSGDGSAMLAQMLDALPSAIAFWDRDLRNVFANRAYIEWYGMTPDQLRGVHARVMLGAELFRLNYPAMRRALAGERQLFERTVRTPSGENRTAQIEYTPYRTSGEVVGFITILVDVSERTRAEQSARAAAEQVATITERQRIEERAHEGILQDLFAVQLRIERARGTVAADSATADALDAALESLDVAVADLRLVLGTDPSATRSGGSGAAVRPAAAS